MWEKFPRGQTPPQCPKVIFFKKIVNYVLAPQDDFGMQKNLVNKHFFLFCPNGRTNTFKSD